MSKFLKAVLFSVYAVLLIQYLRKSVIPISQDIVELEYVFRTPGSLKKILKELKKHSANISLSKLTLNFKALERLPTDLKYILKWTDSFAHFGSNFANGQTAFLENKCEYYNCYISSDKSLLEDLRHFQAVLFDVENNGEYHPILRAPHQYFIFTATESSKHFPICHSSYDSYYNLTWTYRLDSDIRWSYITILDRTGKFVGPKNNMTWLEPMEPTSEMVIRRLVHKKKTAAWFVSNCRTESKREKLATKLSEALAKFNLNVDIYGWCGQLTCPKDRFEECLDMLEQDYYFYLSFENSLSEDYVTANLLYPVRHYTVPIVYGGADYSRFLPPGSYINAGELNATEIAFRMQEAIKNPQVYRNYFRWHNHYVYQESPTVADVCSLCKLLNDPSLGHAVTKNFRQWWNPDYKQQCQSMHAFELKEERHTKKDLL